MVRSSYFLHLFARSAETASANFADRWWNRREAVRSSRFPHLSARLAGTALAIFADRWWNRGEVVRSSRFPHLSVRLTEILSAIFADRWWNRREMVRTGPQASQIGGGTAEKWPVAATYKQFRSTTRPLAQVLNLGP